MMHPVLDLANPFQTSPAPSSAPHISPGESVPLQAYDAGEPAAVESSPAAAGAIPAGYRLVRVEILEMIAAEMTRLKQFEPLPAFIANPSWEYLEAVRV